MYRIRLHKVTQIGQYGSSGLRLHHITICVTFVRAFTQAKSAYAA